MAEGGPFSLWGKFFRHCGFCLPVLLYFLICRSSLTLIISFLRLKRTLEQAQPSMAKRLKAGAASKDPGLWFTFGICDVLAPAIVVTVLHSLFCRLL